MIGTPSRAQLAVSTKLSSWRQLEGFSLHHIRYSSGYPWKFNSTVVHTLYLRSNLQAELHHPIVEAQVSPQYHPPSRIMSEPQTLDVATEGSNGSNVTSPRSSIDSRPPSVAGRTPRLSHVSSNHQHRTSFSESLRAAPGSPRARRQPSLTQSAIQSLIDNPPAPHNGNPAFHGRDWREISIGELVSEDDLKFVELDTGIEEATNVRLLWRRLAT